MGQDFSSGAGGVGSTEPPRRRLDGAGKRAQEPASLAPEREESAGADFAGTGAENGETITDRPGRRVTLLVDTEELAVTESFYGPGERGPEPHVHHEHSDGFVVAEGALTFALANGSLRAQAGTFVLVPPDVVHSFVNEEEGNTRFFNLHAPSCGFGEYLRGRKPDFDQHPPPESGGNDPATVITVRLAG